MDGLKTEEKRTLTDEDALNNERIARIRALCRKIRGIDGAASIGLLNEILEIFSELNTDYASAVSTELHIALRDSAMRTREHEDLPDLVKRAFTLELTKREENDFYPASYWSVLNEISDDTRESISADLIIICHQHSSSPRVLSRMTLLHSCVLSSVGDTGAAINLMQRVLDDSLEYGNAMHEAISMAAAGRQQSLLDMCWDHLLETLRTQTESNKIRTLTRLSGRIYEHYYRLIRGEDSVRKWFELIAILPAESFDQRDFARHILGAPRNARNQNAAEAAAIANQLIPHVESLPIDSDVLLIPLLRMASTFRRQSGDEAGADALQERVIDLGTRDGIAIDSSAIEAMVEEVRRLRGEHDHEGVQRAYERLMRACGFRDRSLTDREYKDLFDRYTVRRLAELARYLIGGLVPPETLEILNHLIARACADGLDEIDPVLDDVIRRFISRGQTEDAESMLHARISSPASGGASSTRWLIRLSEVQLALNKISDSEQTFEKAFQIALLSGAPTQPLLQQRIEFLRRAGYFEKADEMQKRLPAGVGIGVPKVYFLLFATEHLFVGGNLRIGSMDGSNPVDLSAVTVRSTGNSAHIGSFGTVDVKQSWDGGTIVQPMTTEAKRELGSRARHLAQFQSKSSSAVDSLPAIDLSTYHIQPPLLTGGEDDRDGDDIVSSFEANYHRTPPPQRIFITDEFATDAPAAILETHQGRPRDLQIWYNGTREIRIEHNSRVAALIYAPNARVLVGPNNVTFFGAIVAREIIAEGNLTLVFDTSLYGVDLTQI